MVSTRATGIGCEVAGCEGEPDRADARRPPVELGPTSAFEAVTRQMVERLSDELDDIKGRLNGVLFLVAGSVIVDAVVRLVG